MKTKIGHSCLKLIAKILRLILHGMQPFHSKDWTKPGWGKVSKIEMWIDRKISAIDWYVSAKERNDQVVAEASYMAERAEWVALDE